MGWSFSNFFILFILASSVFITFGMMISMSKSFCFKTEEETDNNLHEIAETLGNSDWKSMYLYLAAEISKSECSSRGVGLHGGTCYKIENEDISVDDLDTGNIEFVNTVVDLLVKEPGVSILDLGAGLGWYVQELRKILVTEEQEEKGYGEYNDPLFNWVKGFDGGYGVEELSKDVVSYVDLSIPIGNFVVPSATWVISLNVGPQIPLDSELNYINNLANHACEGIILSWKHSSEAKRRIMDLDEFIDEKFRENGLIIDRTLTFAFRERLKDDERLDNIIVYTRPKEENDPNYIKMNIPHCK